MARKANPIPDGFHSVSAYLSVRKAAKAIEFYKTAFDAKERCRMPSPDGKCIMHAEIQVGDSIVMLADEFPELGFNSPKTLKGSPVMLHLYVKNCDKTFEKAVAAGAKVKRPLENQFYGDRSGMVIDPFGHTWNISTHVKDMSEEELAQAAADCAPPEPKKTKKRDGKKKKK